MKDAVNAITDTNVVLQRLHGNIGGTLGDRFTGYLIHELNHRRFRVVSTNVRRGLAFLQDLESAIGLENFIERLRAHSVECLHRAKKLRARHQYPFRRFLQKLSNELATSRVKKIVGRKNNGILLLLDRQNLMLKNKAGRQNRKGLAVDRLGIQGDNR